MKKSKLNQRNKQKKISPPINCFKESDMKLLSVLES